MTTRIAIIGAGHMGRHHASKVAALCRGGLAVQLAGIADSEAKRARSVAAETGTSAFTSRQELLERADAAIVAVPTADHFEVANAALEAGCDILIEKPIAASSQQAEALLARAARLDRVLRVGSQEWYNPALQALRTKLERPSLVEGHRVGPFSSRGADVDVVRDLMIHDLDVLQKLLREEPAGIQAIGVPIVTEHVDVANARLAFPGGCIANLTASRVSVKPSRKMRFFQPGGHCAIDFLEPAAEIHRRVERLRDDSPGIEKEILAFGPEDALLNQLRSFLHAVEVRDTSASSGVAALMALRTAERIVAAMPPLSEIA